MTKEEAMQILSTRDAHGVLCGYTSGVTEALDIALESLQRDIERQEMVIRASERYLGVVRCKDCRQYIPYDLTEVRGWCCNYKAIVEEDDFCSYGERKKE